MENTTLYTMQLRFVGSNADGLFGNSELEVIAHPLNHAEPGGQPFLGRFLHWQPVFEDICRLMQSSAFHRKAIQRTLSAGLAADLINRETGSKHTFSADELARLCLAPVSGSLGSDLSTAA
jgi:hypothetical protein